MFRYQMPNVVLEPGEAIIINGKDNLFAVGDYICNFNLNEEETLYMAKEGTIIEYVHIPRMSSHETYARRNNSNIWGYRRNAANLHGK